MTQDNHAHDQAQDQAASESAPNTPTQSGFIMADRACIKCGFNLHGQPVYIEPHYDLAITRCPECGTVASLQQYPTISHLTNRFAAALSALWIFALLFAFAVTIGITGGMIGDSNQVAADRLAREIANTYRFTIEDESRAGRIGIWSDIEEEWINANLDQVLQDYGGLISNLDWDYWQHQIMIVFFAVPVGVCWSLVMLGAAKRRLYLFGAVVVLIPSVLVYMIGQDSLFGIEIIELARDIYKPITIPISVSFFYLSFLVGSIIARPIARWTVIAMLPPRFRVPFGILWTRDGKSPPSPKTA